LKSYLLDTNIVSEIRKSRAHGGVLSWVNQLQSDRMFVSAVSLGELQRGVEITRKQDRTKAGEIETWIDRIEATYSVLAMDGRCFREYARLMRGLSTALSEDAMIAATARIHSLTVATRNEADFIHLGVEVFNPFKYRGSD
jgi:toxin FitB